MAPPAKSVSMAAGVEIWEHLELRFDVPNQQLQPRKFEVQIDSMNSIEDTKGNNGERGVLIVTNLRLVWASTKTAKANLSVGWGCVQSASIKTASSKLKGQTQALYIMTRHKGTRYEFIFTSLVKHSPRLFSTVQAVWRSFESTRLYRELQLRGSIVQDQQLVLLPQEEVYVRLDGVWNLSADQGNLGALVVTSVRIVWYAALAENFNVSVPHIQIRTIHLRQSKFGQALVFETPSSAGGYVLGFRSSSDEALQDLYDNVVKYWKLFTRSPILGVEFKEVERPSRPTPVERVEDDVAVVEETVGEARAAYRLEESDGGAQPVYNTQLGLAMEPFQGDVADLFSVMGA